MRVPPQKLIAIASGISLEIAKGKSVNEINEIRNLLNLISNNLQTYIQQKIIFESKNN